MVQHGGKIWNNRGFKWQKIPSFLEGSVLVYGPYRHIPEDTRLQIFVTHPSVVYLLVTKDRRDGGFPRTLPKAGWEKLPRKAYFTVKGQKLGLAVYRKLVESTDQLPKTRTDETIMAIAAKRRI